MNITLLKVNKPFSEYEKYLPYASADRQENVKGLKSDRDKTLSLLSHLLARHKISEELGIPFDKVKFLFKEYGKPYIERADYHFSISHSDNLIVFVSHTSPVGIDVQKIKNCVSPAMRFFTENEQNYISNDPSRFFEIWTKKEAYVKMLGTGLSTSFKSFDVLSDEIKPLLLSTETDGFSLSICAENMSKINIQIKSV